MFLSSRDVLKIICVFPKKTTPLWNDFKQITYSLTFGANFRSVLKTAATCGAATAPLRPRVFFCERSEEMHQSALVRS